MALTLNAEQKSIYDIFSSENQYIIPPYQREYSWTETHCKTLFDDIKRAFYKNGDEEYFLGNIVLAKSKEEKNKLEVIDGQQRLITLTLFLKVLSYFDKDNKALYNSIWIKDRRTDEEKQRVKTTIFMEKDSVYFREVLAFDFSDNVCEPIKEEDNLFKKNICYIYDELKKFKRHNDIFKFSDFLLDKVYILPIKTEDNDANRAREKALKIFETINNRGLNLSTSDIFKARLFSMALNKLKHKEFIAKWRELHKKCEKINYTIDDIFEIYSYTIQIEKGLEAKKQELREFFLYNDNAIFSNKKYDEIVNNLFKIVNSIEFFKQVLKNSNKYNELSKWFQLVDQGHSYLDFHINNFFAYIARIDLQDYGELIKVCKKIIVNNNKRGKEISFLILLSLYINTEQKAIYPYYYHERIELYDLIRLKLIKNTEDDYFVKLIQIAYKFIREYNEN